MKQEERPKNMKEMTILEHLIELKNRVKVILITVGILTLAMMVVPAEIKFDIEFLMAYKPLISLILDIIRGQVMPEGMRLIGLTITSPLEIYFIASLTFGLIFASPVIAYEIYMYVDPALYPHERKLIYPFMSAFIILFIAGALFGYFLITPFTFRAMLIFFSLTGAEPVIHVIDFYNTIFIIVIATGAVFTVPAVLVLLVRVGIIGTDIITRNRKYIYGVAYIVAAIITPDGGMFTNFFLLAVFIVLIEGAVIVAKRYEKRRVEAEETIQSEQELQIGRCRFCGAELHGQIFCPSCGRAQK